MTRQFTHPNFGKSARVEVHGNECALVFVANTPEQAASLAEFILEQLKAGSLNLTLMGKPTDIIEE